MKGRVQQVAGKMSSACQKIRNQPAGGETVDKKSFSFLEVQYFLNCIDVIIASKIKGREVDRWRQIFFYKSMLNHLPLLC